jgi:hypothetical protein
VDKRYLLPVLAVVETMKWSPEVVMLQAHLSSLPGVSKDACLAQVILGQGSLYSCTITTRVGAVLLERESAYHALEQCGDLEWSVASAPSPQQAGPQVARSHAIPAVARAAQIPRLRVKELPAETLNRLAHPYRKVLLLVDGKRSLEEIARLAAKTPQEVAHMLKTLEQFIQF